MLWEASIDADRPFDVGSSAGTLRQDTTMLLKRFYDTHLAQASYPIGCAATGERLASLSPDDTSSDARIHLRALTGLRPWGGGSLVTRGATPSDPKSTMCQ